MVKDGITRSESLHEDAVKIRHTLADAAKSYNWPRVFSLLSENRALVNTTKLGGSSVYTPLHQAAYGGAPVEIAEQPIGMLAWRTLQNARGERPVDVADGAGLATGQTWKSFMRECEKTAVEIREAIGRVLKI